MAKIRHLAIKSKYPTALAEFYVEVFDMEVVLRRETGSVYLTDGYLSLALLPTRGEVAPGIEHYGFDVEDADEVAQRIENTDGMAPKARPNDPPYAEQLCTDPEGNMIDLSVHGFEKVEHQANRKQLAKEDA